MVTRRVPLSIAIGGLLLAVVSPPAWWASAQDDQRRDLIGTWEGRVTQGEASTGTRLQFSERDGAIVWVWSWRAGFGTGEAEGRVVEASASSAELRGRYTVHPARRIVGSPVTLSLKVRGTSMEGTGLTAMVNQPFTLSLSKVSHAGRPDHVASAPRSLADGDRPPAVQSTDESRLIHRLSTINTTCLADGATAPQCVANAGTARPG